MPSYIVKADPDQDFYVRWSTIVDAPTDWGTRSHLERSARRPEEVTPDRFARADERGTSADWPGFAPDEQPYGWTDSDGFIVGEVDLSNDQRNDDEGGWYVLPRANLRALCERLDAEQDPSDLLIWHTEGTD